MLHWGKMSKWTKVRIADACTIKKSVTSLAVFALLVFCTFSCSNSHTADKYDLTVSLNDSNSYYTFNTRLSSERGTSFDSLGSILRKANMAYQDCMREGGHYTSCASYFPQNILICCPDAMHIIKLLELSFWRYSINPTICFDIKIGNNVDVIHSIAVVFFHGSGSLFDRNGRQIDHTWEKKWNSLRILCDPVSVKILKRNDTLFDGSYEQLNKLKGNKLFNSTNITTFYHESNTPIVTINPTCDLPMIRIYELTRYFSERDQFLFQFGKYFNCTDYLNDLPADTLLRRRNSP